MAIRGMYGKRTKIVATIGPASRQPEVLRRMIRAGLDVARINFSHGDHDTHGQTIDTVRQVAEQENAQIAILCDIQGPKIRLGNITHTLTVAPGDRLTLTLDTTADGANGVVHFPHSDFMEDVQPGMPLLYGDGELQFVVREKTPRTLITEVVIGGEVKSRKGIMAPTARHKLSAITEKDKEDIRYALSKHPEFIAMSFVRTAEDIRQMRWMLNYFDADNRAAIIAKIEKHEALEDIENIIAITDGVMVARGDLGLEIPPQNVPFQQKRIIRLCNEAGKPVITATQMLSSMEYSPRPTRAEASDVYNAIIDGTDAVMLSNETATGQYPVESVEIMADIALSAEPYIRKNLPPRPQREPTGSEATADAISHAAFSITEVLKTAAIVTTTISGYTARRVSSERPTTPILCVTPNDTTYGRMALVWGVIPLLVPEFATIDEMLSRIVQVTREQGYVQTGDRLLILAGTPFGIGGQTNFLKMHTVTDKD